MSINSDSTEVDGKDNHNEGDLEGVQIVEPSRVLEEDVEDDSLASTEEGIDCIFKFVRLNCYSPSVPTQMSITCCKEEAPCKCTLYVAV